MPDKQAAPNGSPSGSITDVPGIRVGQAQRRTGGWLSGVSVVLPPPGTVGSVDVRGGGPGTHETDALDPTTMVPTVDAVALTGGSAYGLAAAGGVQRWCEENGRGFAVPGGVVPIVPAAAIFDLGRGGDFSARPTADMGYEAALDAAGSAEGAAVERGNAGAGTGAAIGAGQFKGGLGSASVRLSGDNAHIVVGALAVVNAAGVPWTPGAPAAMPGEGLNTTLAVVATNAVLTVAEAKRTATAAHAGMARALNPVHTLADGDTIFTLATCADELVPHPVVPVASLIELQSAAAEAVRLAILDGVAAAQAVETPSGILPVFPSAGAQGPI
ncbi:L-aminopeptidase/D-esterase-like protein [Arthrobacter stackebrandtii]|uniref:L-aminopeptidase/D-esterase-like protein n=1 Tax=Arthrobacter stackebrandtii TaxID=272161 RepID=A0ABS4YX94_9MICC|nr:L-aminopeptidase/D-esterase-like protein [Arthrobacter stackebrandtii]